MGRIKRLLGIILPSLLVLLALEIGLRLFHTIAKDIEDYRQTTSEWWRYDSRLCWVARPNYSGEVFGVRRAFDAGGYLKVDSKQIDNSSKPKIMLIGDSCTFGHGVAIDDTFGELLEGHLKKYDVVNLALPGYTTLQGRIVLQQHIRKIKPEIVIASFSFNDRRYVLNKQSIDSEKYYKQMYRKGHVIPRVSYYSYTVRYLSRIIQGERPDEQEIPINHDEEFYVHKVFPRVSPDDYRQNLNKIIDLAKEHNARVLLLSLADSPKRAQGLYKGLALLEEGNHAAAVEELWPVAYGSTVFSALAKRFLFEVLEKRGLTEDAQKISLIEEPIVSLHGGKPLFLDVEYAGIMKKVASERGIPFVDGTSALRNHPEYFMDFSHFNENGHMLVAQLLAETVTAHADR
jgi:lysophospholipase L1-like esterase